MLTRYLVRELLATLLVVTTVLLLASIGARFLDYLSEVAQGALALGALWQVLALRVPLFAQLVLPLSLFIAILLTLGRSSSDLETGAMHAAGVSPLRIAAVMLSVVLPMAALVGAMSLWFAPNAALRLAALLDGQRRLHDFNLVVPRRFTTFADGKRVSYVDAVVGEGRELRGVFIAERDALVPSRAVADKQPARRGAQATPMGFIWASSGRQQRDPVSGAMYLELRDGRRYRGVPGDAEFQVTEFARFAQRLSRQPMLLSVAELRARSTPLLARATDAKSFAEWHWRWALPLFTLVTGLLAVAVGRVPPRAGRFARVSAALALFLTYLGMLFAARDLLDRGATLAGGGLVWVHLPFIVVTGYLLLRQQWRAR